MDTLAVWITFGLVYGLVTWLATRKNPPWWFIALVFVSGVFGILVIVAGVMVRGINAVIKAADKLKRKALSLEEVKARNRKRAVYVPVILSALASLVFLVLYFCFGIDIFSVFRNCIERVKGFL